ncbi:hypothetical protein M427DRAFT_53314 [Gonapodya prolifera JEL478]|uniref:SnoaL-like domain-containing protein n=1 Tax=Gonapodya prolifera (strain JEL478) TaxID=1344416 RepID=A0A139APY3_GONPJ|nr:hypothetical protein M427DRAFT_53314 [Gonapodya prolifera JEL478]|eukprot:KXS18821.1 hypothetical protein M427DRAFT_53314 [Gonapodya prolifera JEL478]
MSALGNTGHFEASLRTYLSAYNARDLSVIKQSLHPTCVVVFQDRPVIAGRDAMLPTYEDDWSKADEGGGWNGEVPMIEVVEGPSFEDLGKGRVGLRVKLRTNVRGQVVDVTYIWQEGEVGMVEHTIHGATPVA